MKTRSRYSLSSVMAEAKGSEDVVAYPGVLGIRNGNRR